MRLFYKIGHERKMHDTAINLSNEIYLRLKNDQRSFIINDFTFITTSPAMRYINFILYHKDEYGLYRIVWHNKITEVKFNKLSYYELCKFYYKLAVEIMGAVNNYILIGYYKFEPELQQKRIITMIEKYLKGDK